MDDQIAELITKRHLSIKYISASYRMSKVLSLRQRKEAGIGDQKMARKVNLREQACF